VYQIFIGAKELKEPDMQNRDKQDSATLKTDQLVYQQETKKQNKT
jgi:hypothetical protein